MTVCCAENDKPCAVWNSEMRQDEEKHVYCRYYGMSRVNNLEQCSVYNLMSAFNTWINKRKICAECVDCGDLTELAQSRSCLQCPKQFVIPVAPKCCSRGPFPHINVCLTPQHVKGSLLLLTTMVKQRHVAFPVHLKTEQFIIKNKNIKQ